MPYNVCVLPLVNAQEPSREPWTFRRSPWGSGIDDSACCLPFRFVFLCPCATLKIPTYKFFYLQRAPVTQCEFCRRSPENTLAFKENMEGAEVIDSCIKKHCNLCTFDLIVLLIAYPGFLESKHGKTHAQTLSLPHYS